VTSHDCIDFGNSVQQHGNLQSICSLHVRTGSVAPTILAVTVFLVGCGSGMDTVPGNIGAEANLVSTNSGISPPITFAIGAQTTLGDVASTDLSFVRYDVASGLSYSYGFSVADYDGDGRPDISYFDSYTSGHARLRPTAAAIGHMVWNNGAQEVIVANETFDFQSPTLATNPDEFLFERHVPVDIDGDGKLDIVGVSNSHGSVVAYMNPGVHGTPWVRRVLSSHIPGAVNLTVADVNGDGKPDIIVAMRYQPDSNPSGAVVGIAWLENTGLPTGEWIYHTIDTAPGNFSDPRTLQAGDINNDGKIDVVVSDAVTGAVAWYSQLGPDSWARHTIPGVDTTNAHFGRLIDMDGDGALDIVLPVNKGVIWLRNVNNGGSWETHSVVQFSDSDWANVVTEVAIGDVHHNGTRDIVFSVGSLSGGVASPHSGGLYIAHQSGSWWNIGKIYNDQSSCVGVQLVDFDSNGVLSIVSNSEYIVNSVTLWQNQIGQ
jgi:hypothetical protein